MKTLKTNEQYRAFVLDNDERLDLRGSDAKVMEFYLQSIYIKPDGSKMGRPSLIIASTPSQHDETRLIVSQITAESLQPVLDELAKLGYIGRPA